LFCSPAKSGCWGEGGTTNVDFPDWSTLIIDPFKQPIASCLPLGLQHIHVAGSARVESHIIGPM